MLMPAPALCTLEVDVKGFLGPETKVILAGMEAVLLLMLPRLVPNLAEDPTPLLTTPLAAVRSSEETETSFFLLLVLELLALCLVKVDDKEDVGSPPFNTGVVAMSLMLLVEEAGLR